MANFDLHLRRPTVRTAAKKLATIAAVPVWVFGFGLVEISVQPAQAAYYVPRPYRAAVSDYQRCAAGLLGSGVQAQDATAACAGALYPRALSSCVTDIGSGTQIAATDALSGCRRVRRPDELAKCVVGINGVKSQDTKSLDVLDYCRRSLLPLRFSNCVVGLANQVPAASTTETMSTCIAASNRPRQVLPDFIPSGQPVPLQPLPGGDTSSANMSTGVGTGTTTPISPVTPSQTPTPSQTGPTQTAPSSQRNVPALW
jgi:hypothetical protein